MQFFLLGRVKLNVSFITKESFRKRDTKLVHGVAGLPLSGRSQGENLFFFFFFQGQAKVKEFCIKSGVLFPNSKSLKSQES